MRFNRKTLGDQWHEKQKTLQDFEGLIKNVDAGWNDDYNIYDFIDVKDITRQLFKVYGKSLFPDKKYYMSSLTTLVGGAPVTAQRFDLKYTCSLEIVQDLKAIGNKYFEPKKELIKMAAEEIADEYEMNIEEIWKAHKAILCPYVILIPKKGNDKVSFRSQCGVIFK